METLDPLAGGVQALGGRWGEKNDMKLTTNVVRLSRIGGGRTAILDQQRLKTAHGTVPTKRKLGTLSLGAP